MEDKHNFPLKIKTKEIFPKIRLVLNFLSFKNQHLPEHCHFVETVDYPTMHFCIALPPENIILFFKTLSKILSKIKMKEFLKSVGFLLPNKLRKPHNSDYYNPHVDNPHDHNNSPDLNLHSPYHQLQRLQSEDLNSKFLVSLNTRRSKKIRKVESELDKEQGELLNLKLHQKKSSKEELLDEEYRKEELRKQWQCEENEIEEMKNEELENMELKCCILKRRS